ncbi:aspartate/glutamate racemase family protein [Rhodospirillaceae bacterium]|nr:aspartate/glutamate racemase family protein [Rhodospirillaceae bacterium]
MPPRIVLIHAIEMAIHPIAQAFKTHWPEAETINILDDSLSRDRANSDSLDNKMIKRFLTLGDYAKSIDANGILFTCSAFGPAIEAVAEQHTMPVLKPNEAMFSGALDIGKNICMLVTFENSIDLMSKEFQAMANVRNNESKLDVIFIDGAMLKLQQGLINDHNELILQTAKKLNGYDVLMLAQFSMAGACEAISQQINIPILTAPDAATKLMKKQLKN